MGNEHAKFDGAEVKNRPPRLGVASLKPAGLRQVSWPWQYDGPTLKLELSRVSEKRLKALTLVIDSEHGVETAVAWCLSKRTTLADAMCDLRVREGTPLDNIGQATITPAVGQLNCGLPEGAIAAWVRPKNLDAVIRTALKSDFQEKTTQPFSVGAVMSGTRVDAGLAGLHLRPIGTRPTSIEDAPVAQDNREPTPPRSHVPGRIQGIAMR